MEALRSLEELLPPFTWAFPRQANRNRNRLPPSHPPSLPTNREQKPNTPTSFPKNFSSWRHFPGLLGRQAHWRFRLLYRKTITSPGSPGTWPKAGNRQAGGLCVTVGEGAGGVRSRGSFKHLPARHHLPPACPYAAQAHPSLSFINISYLIIIIYLTT